MHSTAHHSRGHARHRHPLPLGLAPRRRLPIPSPSPPAPRRRLPGDLQAPGARARRRRGGAQGPGRRRGCQDGACGATASGTPRRIVHSLGLPLCFPGHRPVHRAKPCRPEHGTNHRAVPSGYVFRPGPARPGPLRHVLCRPGPARITMPITLPKIRLPLYLGKTVALFVGFPHRRSPPSSTAHRNHASSTIRTSPPPPHSPAAQVIGASSMDPLESEGGSNKPKYSKFTQQELPACKPLLTPGIVIAAFTLIGIIFVPIGLASLFASQEIVELVDRYDTSCVPMDDKVGFIQNSKTDKTCTRTLIVPKHMKSPIQIYYQISDFYQNHRRYVKSRSDKQLRYKNAVHLTKDCVPEGNTADGAPIVPCGLIAWSLFNDTYTISVNKKAIDVNKKGIAWKSDKNNKFGSDIYPSNFQKGGLIGGAKLNESIPLSEQEDLIVWMRTAALPTFRKLYGRIETDIMANDQVTVLIQNNYNTYSFGGSKALVLSTTSWIGGKNNFIGVAYLTIGGLCLFLAMAFIVLYMVRSRTLGDPSYLSWNRDKLCHPN